MSDEIYLLNKSSNYTVYDQITTTIEISRLVFGIVGFALNIALLYTLLIKKPISTTNKLIATFSAGTSLSVLGSSIVISYRLLIQAHNIQMTAFDCFIWIPGIWIYLFGDQTTSQFTLLISVDYFLSLCILNPRWKITDKFAIVCICESLIAGCISVIITFINAHYKRYEFIDKFCYQVDVMNQLHYRINFIIMTAFSMLSLLVYGTTIVALTLKKSSSSEVRRIQSHRQAALMKHTVIVVFCIVMSQGIPDILSIVVTFNSSFVLSFLIRCIYIVFHSALPAYVFCRKLSRKRWLHKQRFFIFIMKACYGSDYKDEVSSISSRSAGQRSVRMNRVQPQEIQ